MQHIPSTPLNYEFSRHLPPAARIESGETIAVEAEDALSGQIRTNADRRDRSKIPYSNPVAGPIVIDNAEPGDALAVRIDNIASRDSQCSTYTGHPGLVSQWLGTDVPHGAHVCPIRDDLIHWRDDVTIPFAPMLGCIGTAPDWGVPSTRPAGPHGGNMDLVEVCTGSTVYLPVFVPGGYLYLGDAHAAMGHGELSATGLEMASISTVTVDVIKAKKLEGPRLESANEIIAVATCSAMERAVAEAYARLILWMEEDYRWDRWQAYDLLTHVGTTSMGHYQFGTIGAKISKRYLSRSKLHERG